MVGSVLPQVWAPDREHLYHWDTLLQMLVLGPSPLLIQGHESEALEVGCGDLCLSKPTTRLGHMLEFEKPL